MSQDLGWVGPACRVCGQELDAETLPTSEGISVVYTCRDHGLAAITNPFDGSVDDLVDGDQ